MIGASGIAVWASTAWRDEAVSWLDESLAADGRRRTGDVEQPRIRPWATVLRAPTDQGDVWLKAAAPTTAYEVGLYELLAEVAPDRVLTPLAADPDRGWVVLPDGGPPLAEQPDGDALVEVHAHALVRYGELQASLLPHVDRMLDLGVPDMRPAVMVDRVDEALAVTRAAATTDAQLALHARIEAVRPEVVEWCAHLAASSLPPSLDHNDLHVWNILPSGAGIRFYDWGDSVVAHPFAAMLVALSDLRHRMGVPIDDAAFVRARDAYLDVFAAAAPEEDLVETLDVACRVAKVARALTWERAVRTAREQGESIDEWADAALQTLASVLDESYLAEEH